ncbi:dioxygenase family protein [Burkholderia cenocepacia]|uniref:Dioxygenase family protein n=1 Tax=Burkholderia cenocepacia TaxID=95486 RepID=A0AAN0RQ77_9BURK|nr:dioxygenase family protein [Burkholderia cenocepacia]
MNDLDQTTLTDTVLERVSRAADQRVRQISRALVWHLHEFVREVKPTQSEWEFGIDFLTSVGKMCSSTRQEFILLSDVLGVSMLVDAINHRTPGAATETTVVGPFYVEPPQFENGSDIRGHLSGMPMYIEGTVRDLRGAPIANAIVDIWHADENGFYDLQTLEITPGLAGRGRFHTDSKGHFHTWTVRPSAYPIPNDGPVGKMLEKQGRHPFRPEHIHFMIEAPGFGRLVTHLFAEGDEYLDSDVVFGVKASLIRPFKEMHGGSAPDGTSMDGCWYELCHDFVLENTDAVS